MYDSLTELIEKISLGEDTTIEFKRAVPHRNSLADEIAALNPVSHLRYRQKGNIDCPRNFCSYSFS